MQTVRIEQRRAPARPRDRRSGAPGFGAEPHLLKDPPQRDDKPNSVPDSPPEAAHQATTIPLAPPSLAGSSNLPGGFGRAALWRLPIWSCSVRGLACHSPCGKRGALLPHLFTLTRRRPAGSGGASPEGPARRSLRSKRMRAVCFLCHFPSGRPDRGLPGALPSGVRTFLPAPRHQVTGHAAVVCPSTADCQRPGFLARRPSSGVPTRAQPARLLPPRAWPDGRLARKRRGTPIVSPDGGASSDLAVLLLRDLVLLKLLV